MIKKFNRTDIVVLLAALASLIFSEILWFQGEVDTALWVGIWVPTILGFGAYLKLVKMHNDA